jgi:hypothetical protein
VGGFNSSDKSTCPASSRHWVQAFFAPAKKEVRTRKETDEKKYKPKNKKVYHRFNGHRLSTTI